MILGLRLLSKRVAGQESLGEGFAEALVPAEDMEGDDEGVGKGELWKAPSGLCCCLYATSDAFGPGCVAETGPKIFKVGDHRSTCRGIN